MVISVFISELLWGEITPAKIQTPHKISGKKCDE